MRKITKIGILILILVIILFYVLYVTNIISGKVIESLLKIFP